MTIYKRPDLTELDRIERIDYMLREKEIEEHYNSGYTGSRMLLAWGFVLFVTFSLLELLFFEIKGIHLFSMQTVIDSVRQFLVVLIIILVIDITFLVINIKRRNKELNELKDEFFDEDGFPYLKL
jgi:flagellar biosynthesis protein FlhB